LRSIEPAGVERNAMTASPAQPRTYRHRIKSRGLVPFTVRVKETDLLLLSEKSLEKMALESVLRHRGYLERFIQGHPELTASLSPWVTREPMPGVVEDMVSAGLKAGVGPMAAVAGALAQRVGRDLLVHSRQVIVENGGDVFIKADEPVTVGIFAGTSPLSLQLGIRVAAGARPKAVCTSSGTVGHSLSFGKADAVCVCSLDCALADAAATAIGNQVTRPDDISRGIEFGKAIEGVQGILIVLAERMGAWGQLELVPLRGK
jgi:hypothetical protein